MVQILDPTPSRFFFMINRLFRNRRSFASASHGPVPFNEPGGQLFSSEKVAERACCFKPLHFTLGTTSGLGTKSLHFRVFGGFGGFRFHLAIQTGFQVFVFNLWFWLITV